MLEAIKALEVRNKEDSTPLKEFSTGKSEAKIKKKDCKSGICQAVHKVHTKHDFLMILF
jgi:hypothetical protein